jgi:hypothetical protein
MSDSERSPASRALDELVAEAREHLDVEAPAHGRGHAAASTTPAASSNQDPHADIDWERLEARLMASIEKEKPALLRDVEESAARGSRVGLRSRDGFLRVTALALAAAATVALFVRKDRDAPVSDPMTASAERASASSLRSTEGAGDVRINQVVVTPGYTVRSGDSIEVDGARAVFERSRKVTWLLEADGRGSPSDPELRGGARAHVSAAGEPLVLGLDNGVIEAQVAPVSVGEAFAVDVATDRGVVRVAVHGTHLRVARAGNRVTVDLTEGVVSIGVPPRTGVTYGTIVTAPAHVELDATDLRTLRVDHTPEAVRAAIPLSTHDVTAAVRPETAATAAAPSLPAPAPLASTAKGAVLRPTEIAAAPIKLERPKAPLPPRDAITAAIRDCAAARSRSGDVRVTVTSNLRLRVSGAGEVESAQFSPPLLPEIQSCAAQVIYKTKLDETGLVTLPLEFSY